MAGSKCGILGGGFPADWRGRAQARCRSDSRAGHQLHSGPDGLVARRRLTTQVVVECVAGTDTDSKVGRSSRLRSSLAGPNGTRGTRPAGGASFVGTVARNERRSESGGGIDPNRRRKHSGTDGRIDQSKQPVSPRGDQGAGLDGASSRGGGSIAVGRAEGRRQRNSRSVGNGLVLDQYESGP